MSPRIVSVLVLLVTCSLAARAHAQATVPASPSVAELVARIDADPDTLHNDFTPAVWGLCAHGLDGALAVVPLLEAASRDTRMHASRALSCAVSHWFGWQPGQGFALGSGAEARFRAVWDHHGPYEWDADPAARHASAQAWQTWIEAHVGQAPPPPDEPSSDAIRAALEPTMAAARACAPGAGRTSAELTFASAGSLSRVRVRGARGPAARCIERALQGALVPPFAHPSYTFSIGITR
jgi:hypothetical protein